MATLIIGEDVFSVLDILDSVRIVVGGLNYDLESFSWTFQHMSSWDNVQKPLFLT